MITFMYVVILVYIALVITALAVNIFAGTAKDWRSIAVILAFPALYLAIMYVCRRYPGGWI
ncbi:hypothetical protein D3C71_1132560 [compost metagenome]